VAEFLTGPLAQHFVTMETPRVLTERERDAMLQGTQFLALPCINNTAFACGQLHPAALLSARTYTSIRRADRHDSPYLLWELAHDLRRRIVSKNTISEELEQRIRALAGEILPERPEPVIVEDDSGSRYLILDGNKRLAALTLTDTLGRREHLHVWMGRSKLPWASLLSCYEMQPSTADTAAVLLVDDDDAALSGLTELLRGAGLPVMPCRCFEDARTFALHNPVQALLTDVRLGNHNGLHLIQIVRTTHAGARLVAFSGHEDPVLRRDAEALDATFLLKPLDLVALLAMAEAKGDA
jgi:CheY-like chemotaxis protein